MEMKIIEEKENPLFGRKEIIVEVVSTISPSNTEALTILSKKFSAPEDGIKVKGIYGNFGAHTFNILANIYKSKSEKDKIELKTKKEIEAEKKAEEARIKAEEEAKAAKAEAEKSVEESAENNIEEVKEEKTE